MADLVTVIAFVVAIIVSLYANFVRKAIETRRAEDLLIRREQLVVVLYNLVLFVAMLGGIFANYFWTHDITAPIDLNRFWKPVLISPVIFMPVYVAATKQTKGLIPVLVAFQNGFFWQTILEGVTKAVPGG